MSSTKGAENQPVDGLSLRYETEVPRVCVATGCERPVASGQTGRPAKFCSASCRVRAQRQRQRQRGPLTVEVDTGSASSRGRRPDRHFLVRIRRADDEVVVAVGLSRTSAEWLAERIKKLVE